MSKTDKPGEILRIPDGLMWQLPVPGQNRLSGTELVFRLVHKEQSLHPGMLFGMTAQTARLFAKSLQDAADEIDRRKSITVLPDRDTEKSN